jgi:hypothetical protein
MNANSTPHCGRTREELVGDVGRKLRTGDRRANGHGVPTDDDEVDNAENTLLRVVETVCSWDRMGIPEEETLMAIESHASLIRHALPQPLSMHTYLRYRLSKDHPELHYSEANLDAAIDAASTFFRRDR